jgi:hypothetical protein
VHNNNNTGKKPAAGKQGDQIGRIFAHWVIIYFGQFIENYSNIPHYGYFFHGEGYVLI